MLFAPHRRRKENMNKSRRIFRRKEAIKRKRLEKMADSQREYTYDKVFTFQHFVISFKKCLKGVTWKTSVQNYISCAVERLYEAFQRMAKHDLPSLISDREIEIRERGKKRIIFPIHIKDRVIQKVLCDFALIPILTKHLIYDNGASLAGKGVSFSRKRMTHHLTNAVKEFGTDFYTLSFDFKNYFNSVPHKTCRKILERYICDKEIIEITMQIIKAHHRKMISKIKNKELKKRELNKLDNDELCGICLGSQVSQIMALIIVNDIDHYIKDKMRCKYYVRYMDDGIVLLKTKEEAHKLFDGMKVISNELGLEFNEKKTHIIKISKGFTFLKVRYFVTNDGKIVRKLTRKGIVRMRRKLKKYKKKIDNNEMTLDNVYDSIQSWLEHSRIAKSYKTKRKMLKLYDKLYDGYKITRKWKRKHGGKNVLQADRWAKYRWSCVS